VLALFLFLSQAGHIQHCSLMAKIVAVPAWFCGVLWLFSTAVHAQALQDTLSIREVEVFAKRFSASTAGVELQRYELSNAPGSALQSIAHFLEMQSASVLRGYGPGGSYSASLQGGSSSQMQVLLNGVPFENPSLAQADLSLLPSFLFSNISLLTGPSTALLGNASVAGTLFLDQHAGATGLGPWLSQKMTVGSFGDIGSGTVMHYGKGRLSAKTSVYIREAQNDFERQLPNGTVEPQPNAYFRTRGLQQALDYRSRGGWNTDALFWYNETDRRIPPILSRRNSIARQHDANLRAQVHADRSFGRIHLSTDLAYDHGALDFADQGIDDQSNFNAWHAQAEAKTTWKKTELSMLAFYRHSTATSDNYTSDNFRSSPAIVARAQRSLFGEKTRLSVAVRSEWLNGRLLPVVPTIGFDQQLAKHWKLRGSVSRVYRLPGLNALFWMPGGNPNLLPESGWSQELGIYHDRHFGESQLQASVGSFSRQVENWIIWQPGPTYWQPENLRSVWSRGLEIRVSWSQILGNWKLHHRAEVNYVRSTNLRSGRSNDSSLGNQLIYVPLWAGMWEERIAFRKWGLAATMQYRSERFTTADNSRSLDPYALIHLQADYSFSVKNMQIRANLAARNLLNTDVVQVVNRPMPGRHFLLGVEFNLFKKKPQSLIP
jgi:iron complex outermembrane receptor protein